MLRTLPKRPIRQIVFDETQRAASADYSADLAIRPIASERMPQLPTMTGARPSPTFAGPVIAEPVAALPQEELPAIRVQRPIPQSASDLERADLEQQQARVMIDKDKNPILNALKGFGLRFLQTKGGLMERLGGGAFGVVENTLIPDAQGTRGTVDERFMQAGRINKAQGAYDSAVKIEKDHYDSEARKADLQNKALRPWQESEKIRTKDDATEERARAAQARIDLAITKLGLETKSIASEGKMWIVTNEPDGRGGLRKSLKPLTDETGNQLNDPKVLGYENQRVIVADRNKTAQQIAAERNNTTLTVADKRLAGQQAASGAAMNRTVVSNSVQAAKTIQSIKNIGEKNGKTPEEIKAKVKEFINSLPVAVRPKQK